MMRSDAVSSHDDQIHLLRVCELKNAIRSRASLQNNLVFHLIQAAPRRQFAQFLLRLGDLMRVDLLNQGLRDVSVRNRDEWFGHVLEEEFRFVLARQRMSIVVRRGGEFGKIYGAKDPLDFQHCCLDS